MLVVPVDAELLYSEEVCLCVFSSDRDSSHSSYDGGEWPVKDIVHIILHKCGQVFWLAAKYAG